MHIFIDIASIKLLLNRNKTPNILLKILKNINYISNLKIKI